jgi:hypothetical protein
VALARAWAQRLQKSDLLGRQRDRLLRVLGLERRNRFILGDRGDAGSGDLALSRLGWAARLLVSIILVAWLLHNFSFAPVVDRMGGIRTGELVGILGLASAQFLMFGLRWWLVGMACAAELPLRSAVRIAFISMFFNQVLPATVGGDIVRTYLASREGVRIHRAIVGVMIGPRRFDHPTLRHVAAGKGT